MIKLMIKDTNLAFALGNEQGALNKLHTIIGFEVAPIETSQLVSFYTENDWHYVIIENAKDGKKTCSGTYTEKGILLVFSYFTNYGDIVSIEEMESAHIINALTDILEDDHTAVIKAESAMEDLVEDGYIRAKTADDIIGMMNSRQIH